MSCQVKAKVSQPLFIKLRRLQRQPIASGTRSKRNMSLEYADNYTD